MPLLTLQAQQLHDAVRRKSMTTVTKLLDADPTLLNATNHKGETLLHRMVRLDVPDHVSTLLERGINTALKDRQGNTALHVALYEVKAEKNPNVQEIIRLLIDKGACVCCPNARGKVPICTLITQHQTDLVRLAMARNPRLVNARVRDLTQHPPYHCVDAHWCGLRSSFRPVRHHPSSRFDPSFWQGQPLLVYAIWAGDTPLVQAMLEAGADPKAFVPYYGNFLCMDSMFDQLDVAQLLLNKGVTVPKAEEIGATALHMAALHGRAYKLIRLLLKAGFDPNARSQDGCTPFHDAVIQKDMGSIKILLKAGADIEATTNVGTTPLMFAARMQWEEGVAFLLAEGASVSSADADGNTALHYAAVESYRKVMDMLVEAGGDAEQKNEIGITPAVVDEVRGQQDWINFRSGRKGVGRTREQRKELLGYALATNRQGMGRDAYWTLTWLELRDWHKKAREAELTKKPKS